VHLRSPLSENVFGAHMLQSSMETEASTVEKYPGPHGEHSVLFNSDLKKPDTHG